MSERSVSFLSSDILWQLQFRILQNQWLDCSTAALIWQLCGGNTRLMFIASPEVEQ